MSNKFFRDALLTTTIMVGAVTIASPAWAQDAEGKNPAEEVQMAPAEGVSPDETNDGDEIVVTGTLIRNPNLVASAPVTVVGEAEVELQQAFVAEELLREIPGVVPSVGSAVNNGNGGSSFVDLRGLGPNRNLVLLDGTRIIPAGLDGIVDLNNIPLALIERTDILTGGASTTYGADAVTGVINFITKDDFSGIDLEASQQITERGDGNVFRVDATIGANLDDGRGNVVFSAGYQQADPVFQGDRPFSVNNVSSVNGTAGGSGTAAPSVINIPGVGSRQINDAGQLVPFFAPFNFNPFNIFATPFERFNIFGAASYEVTDGVQVYTRGLFSKNSVTTVIAPSGSFGFANTFNLGNPFLPAAARNQICAAADFNPAVAGNQGLTQAQCDAAAATTDPTNPNFRTFRGSVARRFVEGGPRTTEYTTTIFDYKIGLRGDITSSLGFDIFGTYGESENISRSQGQGLRSRLVQSVDAVRGPGGTITCRDTSNNCQPINLFGPVGSISPESFNFLNAGTQGSTRTTLSQIRGLVSGDFGFGSPFAEEKIGVAVGGEYRNYSAQSQSDLATQTPGEVLGAGGANPDISGQYDVYEAFGEVNIPLISDRPFFRSLTLELGGRYSDYSTSGKSYTYKAAGSYEPFEGIKVRGGYNRAARSPNIGELFDPIRTLLENLATDPCQRAGPVNNANLRAVCLAQGAPANTIGLIEPPSAGQINFTGGGNPNLDVEKADTFTVGAVFQPRFIPGLAVTVDYYNIKVRDAISEPTVTDALRACFGAPPFTSPPAGAATSLACTQIRRNPLTGGLDGEASTTPGLLLQRSNQGRLETSGVDLIFSYRRDLGFAGLNLNFNGNWTEKNIFQATPTSDARDCVSQYGVDCSSIQPEFSFSQRSTLTFGGTSVSLLWRFIDAVRIQDDQRGTPGPPPVVFFLPEFEDIGSKHYFDLTLRQEVADKFTFIFGVQNLFDQRPPIVGSNIGATAFNSGNTYPSTYDPLGRRYAASVNLRF